MNDVAPASAPYVPAPTSALFRFDGGAAGWFWVQVGGLLVTFLTLGICYPWAVVMTYRWKSSHTFVNGHRLRFTGSSVALFGLWIKWWFLSAITLGIYTFWVYPRLQKWIIERQAFEDPSVR